MHLLGSLKQKPTAALAGQKTIAEELLLVRGMFEAALHPAHTKTDYFTRNFKEIVVVVAFGFPSMPHRVNQRQSTATLILSVYFLG